MCIFGKMWGDCVLGSKKERNGKQSSLICNPKVMKKKTAHFPEGRCTCAMRQMLPSGWNECVFFSVSYKVVNYPQVTIDRGLKGPETSFNDLPAPSRSSPWEMNYGCADLPLLNCWEVFLSREVLTCFSFSLCDCLNFSFQTSWLRQWMEEWKCKECNVCWLAWDRRAK